MTNLQPTNQSAALATMASVGAVANHYAANAVFADYANRKAGNTLRAQLQDLAAFAEYLGAVGVAVDPIALQTAPSAWMGITWGIVKGFAQWGISAGFSVTTINRRLSTVKVYAKLANQAGCIDDSEYMRVRGVSGYSRPESKRIDSRREVSRQSNKKASATRISEAQARQLKAQPDSPQGRRDALMMALLLDHGLRAGEVVALTVDSFDLRGGFVYVDRPKVGIEDHKHKMSADTLIALRNWIDSGDCPAAGPILRGSRKGGALTGQGVSAISLTKRVADLGNQIGIAGLSAHDCRHFWASFWADKVSVLRLQEAGGWASLEMPRRYVARAAVANEGMA
jgi:integrase